MRQLTRTINRFSARFDALLLSFIMAGHKRVR